MISFVTCVKYIPLWRNTCSRRGLVSRQWPWRRQTQMEKGSSLPPLPSLFNKDRLPTLHWPAEWALQSGLRCISRLFLSRNTEAADKTRDLKKRTGVCWWWWVGGVSYYSGDSLLLVNRFCCSHLCCKPSYYLAVKSLYEWSEARPGHTKQTAW